MKSDNLTVIAPRPDCTDKNIRYRAALAFLETYPDIQEGNMTELAEQIAASCTDTVWELIHDLKDQRWIISHETAFQLEQYEEYLWEELNQAQLNWAKSNCISPLLPVGSRIVFHWHGNKKLTGTVCADNGYLHATAHYKVKPDYETDPNRYLAVPYEDAEPLPKEDHHASNYSF